MEVLVSESIDSTAGGEEFWRNHVLTAQNFQGSDAEYCRRNEVNASTFYSYKAKLGVIKPIKRRNRGFMKVEREIISGMETPKKVSSDTRGFPDAKWAASFVTALWEKK